jgi:hypothetical protein
MIGAFQSNAFQNNAFQTAGGILFDTHDGGERRKKEEAERRKYAAKQKARREEILALFEQIVEGKPQIAEEIAEPFVIVQATAIAPAVINYDAMFANLDKIEQIYNAWIDMDDEDILRLL